MLCLCSACVWQQRQIQKIKILWLSLPFPLCRLRESVHSLKQSIQSLTRTLQLCSDNILGEKPPQNCRTIMTLLFWNLTFYTMQVKVHQANTRHLYPGWVEAGWLKVFNKLGDFTRCLHLWFIGIGINGTSCCFVRSHAQGCWLIKHKQQECTLAGELREFSPHSFRGKSSQKYTLHGWQLQLYHWSSAGENV